MITKITRKTENFVYETLKEAEGGHDWWHIQRVRNLAMNIGAKENADLFVVELGALLHDIADSKFHGGDEEIGPRTAREFLQQQKLESALIGHIEQIVRHISFKGEKHKQAFRSKELDVIQDADRLDALGAIGIARAFNYGGHAGRLIYKPTVKPQKNMNREEYKNNTSPTINHFYEKLLLLKERMNTPTGKSLAEHRHQYMVNFLEEFFGEWDGER
ncbi:MAG: HD domain-containing protein [Bacteroidales bacterium]|nr:HD domain-containing protein [Bacteroidales bacterium]MCF8349840.1 HD domain-containing protein [Bacteroidales bacterium]MCF8375564.1 HD domain-containing protein [Bacteroidales bacterium]